MRSKGSILLMFAVLGATSAALAQPSSSSIAHVSHSSASSAEPSTSEIPPPYRKSKTKAALDGRIASLKTALQLTPHQKDLWHDVQVVIHYINGEAYRRHQGLADMPEPASFLNTLARIADGNERRAEDLRKFISAIKPFAASLSDVQRKRLPEFLGITDNYDDSREPTGQRLIFELQEDETDPAK